MFTSLAKCIELIYSMQRAMSNVQRATICISTNNNNSNNNNNNTHTFSRVTADSFKLKCTQSQPGPSFPPTQIPHFGFKLRADETRLLPMLEAIRQDTGRRSTGDRNQPSWPNQAQTQTQLHLKHFRALLFMHMLVIAVEICLYICVCVCVPRLFFPAASYCFALWHRVLPCGKVAAQFQCCNCCRLAKNRKKGSSLKARHKSLRQSRRRHRLQGRQSSTKTIKHYTVSA